MIIHPFCNIINRMDAVKTGGVWQRFFPVPQSKY
jgi:hypothetical protein